jgi:molybdenum cofactor biosynthesis enzyme MoaA
MSRIKIPLLCVHITNVCNLNCPDCQTFSNYKFTGHQLWKDYEAVYQKWSELLEPNEWHILGGEPTLNPSYLEWIKGLSSLWPGVSGSMATNGSTIFADNYDLYHTITGVDGGFYIRVQLHNALRMQETLDTRDQAILQI